MSSFKYMVLFGAVLSALLLGCGDIGPLKDESNDKSSDPGEPGTDPVKPGDQCEEPGKTFPSADGCNTCTCDESGAIACTLAECADPEPEESPCEWAIAESEPPQVDGKCTFPNLQDDQVKIQLVSFAPSDGKFLVLPEVEMLKDVDLEYTYDKSNFVLAVTTTPLKGGDAILRVRYTGDVTIPKENNSKTKGKVVDASGLDGCKYLIETPEGMTFEPINLPSEFQKDGLEIEFNYDNPETDVGSICMAGTLVTVSGVTIAGADGGSCDEARDDFRDLVKTINALDKSCTTDADCAAFGTEPKSGCPKASFTSNSSLDSHKTKLSELSTAVSQSCPEPEAICNALFPSEPQCNTETNTCEGKAPY